LRHPRDRVDPGRIGHLYQLAIRPVEIDGVARNIYAYPIPS
jgi:hypothetical protein